MCGRLVYFINQSKHSCEQQHCAVRCVRSSFSIVCVPRASVGTQSQRAGYGTRSSIHSATTPIHSYPLIVILLVLYGFTAL